MDYYEELGIPPTATEEEIRRAHRRLTKLFHPDQQTDEGIKLLAETQMRRLNSIVEILNDPERRRAYDEQRRDGLAGFGPSTLNQRAQTPRRTFGSLPWWLVSTAGAIALTVGAVWFWADNWGSSFANRNPTYIPSEATAQAPPTKPVAAPPAAQPAAPDSRQAASSAAPPARVDVETARRTEPPMKNEGSQSASSPPQTVEVPANLSSRTVATVPISTRRSKTVTVSANHPPEIPQAAPSVPTRKTLNLGNTHVSASVRPVNVNLPPPPNVPTALPSRDDAAPIPVAAIPSVPVKFPAPGAPAKVAAAETTLPAAVKSTHQSPLEGEWVYAPTEPEKPRPGFYPPEFIDLRLFRSDGGLHGQYRAKYHITDRPIPPDVSFTLTPDAGANKFVWKSSNGSKGTLKITSMNGPSIKIEWRTTVYTNGPALTAGTATLVRRQQQISEQ